MVQLIHTQICNLLFQGSLKIILLQYYTVCLKEQFSVLFFVLFCFDFFFL